MRAINDTMVLSPSLTISIQQIDEMVDIMEHCLDLTSKKFGMI